MAQVIVIGSGFGGAIAAKRYTEAGYTVSIIEMGERWTDPAKWEQTQDVKYMLRLFRDYPTDYLQSQPKLIVTQGMGYGGGSLVYAKIHIRAPDSAFASGWPSGYTRSNLGPYYDRVEARLGTNVHSNTFQYKRAAVFKQGCLAAGLPEPTANSLADTSCRNCGWCVPICKFDRKNTMAKTYLADAEATGRLTVWTNRKVKLVAKKNGKYRVLYWKTDGEIDNYHMVNSGTTYYQEADTVVIAAGSVESPCILKRSRNDSLPWGYSRINSIGTSRLGKDIDGNGDFVVGGFVPQTTDPYRGTMMFAHMDGGNFVLEDVHAIPVAPAVKFEGSFYLEGREQTWGLAYKQKFKGYGQHMLGIGIIGQSPSGANITVQDDDGVAALSGTAFQPPVGALDAAKSVITSLGGEVAASPWDRDGIAATVHPTGGCNMGEVVEPTDLGVYNNPGLHVIDGSVIPHAFANPSHTISAVAEKAMDVILGAPGAPSW